jgi:AcrR family transcriptional regulator
MFEMQNVNFMERIPSGKRRTHAERSAATREHLIATAIAVIQDRSLEAMSINELARSAGMTSGAVQHHFESKAVLMMNVLDELLQARDDAGDLWPKATLAISERAVRFVEAAWHLVYAQPRFIAAWNIYLGCRDQPEVLDHIARTRMAVGRRLQASFLDSFPELAATPDREAFASMVFSTLRGMGLLQLFPSSALPFPSELPAAQRACLAELIAARCQAAIAMAL